MRPVSAARLERKLRAIVGAQGSNLLPSLDEVVGLITLEHDRPEWAAAGGEKLASFANFFAAGGVGAGARVLLRNMPASGELGVLEWCTGVDGADPTNGLIGCEWWNPVTDPITNYVLTGATARDRRVASGFGSGGGLSASVRVWQPVGVNDFVETDERIFLMKPTNCGFWKGAAVIPPDSGLVFFPADPGNGNHRTNAAMIISLMWRVIPLENSVLG